MKRKAISKTSALVVVVCLLMSMFSMTASATEVQDAPEEKVKITFVADTLIESIATFVEINDISMDSFSVANTTGESECTSGYVINEQDSFERLWDDFVSEQVALLSEGIESFGDNEAANDMSAMLAALENNTIQMSVICETASPLARSNSYLGAEIVESIEVLSSHAADEAPEEDAPATRASYGNWLPTYGWGGAWPSSTVSDATYLEVSYRWDYAYQLAGLTGDADSTFEADLVLYNYDDTAMATGWHSGNYSYNTNQPRPYKDTQAFDNGDEPVFCIGCSDASSLVAGKDYYWIAYGNETGSTSCKAKLNLQRGSRLIDAIYEQTWNIFGDETVTIISFTEWNTATNPKKYFQIAYV